MPVHNETETDRHVSHAVTRRCLILFISIILFTFTSRDLTRGRKPVGNDHASYLNSQEQLFSLGF